MAYDKETGTAILPRRHVITEAPWAVVRCKFCGETVHLVRFGTYKGRQRYYCKKCKRKFADNDALPGMKTPTEQISSALTMFYEGMSLGAIGKELQRTHNNHPPASTVREWVLRFTKLATRAAQSYVVQTGSIWVADETVLKIGGQNVWFWDVMDNDTRFLLASHLSLSPTTRDAQMLILRAIIHADQLPQIIITDKLRPYFDGTERIFGADTHYILSKGLFFRMQENKDLIDRFHGTLKGRTKVMRRIKGRETAKLVMDAWLVHYDFFRPSEGLRGRTPAEAAGIKFPFRNWTEVVGGNYGNGHRVQGTV